MSRVHRVNSLLLVAALLFSVLLTGVVSRTDPAHSGPDARGTVEDATGAHVAVRDYSRIVSTSTIAAESSLMGESTPAKTTALPTRSVASRTLWTEYTPVNPDR